MRGTCSPAAARPAEVTCRGDKYDSDRIMSSNRKQTGKISLWGQFVQKTNFSTWDEPLSLLTSLGPGK